MGKKNRRSKQLSNNTESPKIVEVNVEGPLTLDEAKVMGEVPADYHIVEDEGLLKRASHLFMGEDKHENLPAVPDSAEGLTSESDSKKVTFANPIHEEQVVEGSKKTKSDHRKSLLEFLHLKKKNTDDDYDDDDGEKLAAVEPHPVDIVEAPKHQDPEPISSDIEAIEDKVSSAMSKGEKPTEDAPVEDASAIVADSAEKVKEEPAKKKGVFNNLFHHKKKKEEVADKIETVEKSKEAEDSEKAPAQSDHVVPTETATEKAADTVASGEEKASTERKSFFGGLFAKKDSNEPNVNEEVIEMEEAPKAEEIVHEDAVADATGTSEVANADQTSSGGCFGFFGGTTNTEETAAPVEVAEEAAVEAQPESPTPQNTNRRWLFFGCSYPQPAANAEVVKAGTAQKQSYILHGNRFRHIRLMSDGVFQFGLKANQWEHAKGVKLTDSMTVTTMENKSSFPAVVKVCIPEVHPIVLSFKTTRQRDEWATVLNDFKRRLSATTPNADGVVQVLKSSVFEEEDDAAGTGQVKEATSEN